MEITIQKPITNEARGKEGRSAPKGFLKRRNGFSLIEIVFVLTIVVIMTLVYFNSPVIMETANRIQSKSDMGTITSAILIYQANNVSQTVPAVLGDLITGLSAAQSITGAAQTDFIRKDGVTSDSSTFVDKWGNAYVYDAANRTLTSTANGGTAITVNF